MKRVIPLALAVFLALSCALSLPASAGATASKTICSSSAELFRGDSSGELDVEYSVSSNTTASYLGVQTIKFYKDTGEYVATIRGSTANGLVKLDHGFHMGTYTWKYATPGEYYYAEVTVYATIGSDSDTYTHTTATIKAP